MANNSGITSSIDKVVLNAREKYNELMQSQYVATDMKVDGVETKGQLEENVRKDTTKEQYTRTCTCMLGVDVHRGSTIEIKPIDQTEYTMKGIVLTIPSRTPVDYCFTALLYNTKARRYRKQLIYSSEGYVIGDNPIIEDEIPCFVQRIGMRERQINAGIDSNSVNEIITSKDWDIQLNDLLYIGSDSYIITDIRELDEELFYGTMTYYRA